MDWSFGIAVVSLLVAGASLFRAFLADRVAKKAAETSEETQRLQQEHLSRGLVDFECTGARREGEEVVYALANNTRSDIRATALPSDTGSNEIRNSKTFEWRSGTWWQVRIRDNMYGLQPGVLVVTYQDCDDEQIEEKTQRINLPEPSDD